MSSYESLNWIQNNKNMLHGAASWYSDDRLSSSEQWTPLNVKVVKFHKVPWPLYSSVKFRNFSQPQSSYSSYGTTICPKQNRTRNPKVIWEEAASPPSCFGFLEPGSGRLSAVGLYRLSVGHWHRRDTVVQAFVSCRLDYCNSLLAGVTDVHPGLYLSGRSGEGVKPPWIQLKMVCGGSILTPLIVCDCVTFREWYRFDHKCS